jgi:hypothetical protein
MKSPMMSEKYKDESPNDSNFPEDGSDLYKNYQYVEMATSIGNIMKVHFFVKIQLSLSQTLG